MVGFTEEAGIVPHFAREEAERRHQYYLGPEHLPLGLLVADEHPMVRGLRAHGLDLKVGDDNPAAWVLRAHGLDLETVRAGIDRLVAEGVLPGPQPSDAELLATLGIDLEEVMAPPGGELRLGGLLRRGPARAATAGPALPARPRSRTPLIYWRVFRFVAEEAAARGQDATPAHWLLALLRDAQDQVEVTTGRYPVERRKRAMFGLPDHGPSPIRLLVESHGLTLDQLRAATLEELDQTL